MMSLAPRSVIPLLVIDEIETATGRPLNGRTRLTKLVFLLEQLRQDSVSKLVNPADQYGFVPYRFGPFSKDLFDDLESLESAGKIRVSTRELDRFGKVIEHLYSLTDPGRRDLRAALRDQKAARLVRRFIDDYAAIPRYDLSSYVHQHFPRFVRPEV